MKAPEAPTAPSKCLPSKERKAKRQKRKKQDGQIQNDKRINVQNCDERDQKPNQIKRQRDQKDIQIHVSDRCAIRFLPFNKNILYPHQFHHFFRCVPTQNRHSKQKHDVKRDQPEQAVTKEREICDDRTDHRKSDAHDDRDSSRFFHARFSFLSSYIR